jgi:CHAT domain-containing protein
MTNHEGNVDVLMTLCQKHYNDGNFAIAYDIGVHVLELIKNKPIPDGLPDYTEVDPFGDWLDKRGINLDFSRPLSEDEEIIFKQEFKRFEQENGVLINDYSESPSKDEVCNFIEIKHCADLYAKFYNCISMIQREIGDYEDALINQKRSYEILNRFYHSDHNRIGHHYMNMGLISISLLDEQSAFSYFDKAVTIFNYYESPDPLGAARTYANIGTICAEYRLFNKALECFVIAQRCYNKAKKEMPERFTPHYDEQQNLEYNIEIINATLCGNKKQGKFNRLMKKSNKSPKLTGAILESKANAFYESGQYKNSLWEYERALKVYKEAYMPTHTLVIGLLERTLIIRYKLGIENGFSERVSELINQIPSLYISAMRTYSVKLRLNKINELANLPSFVYAMARNINVPSECLYKIMLCSKDIGKEAEFIMRNEISVEQLPEQADVFTKLKELRIEYQLLIENIPNDKDEIARLSSKIQELEIALAPYSRSIDFKTHMELLTPEMIQKKLTSESALLEYAMFHYEEKDSERGDGSNKYIVFLLRNDRIKWFVVDGADELNGLVDSVRRKIIPDVDGKINDATEDLSTLYDKLIDPVAEFLVGVTHLYISPDDMLFNLPFDLLRDKKGLLMDNYTISYVSSGRDLARPENWNEPFNGYRTVSIIANPAFALPPDITDAKSDSTSSTSENNNRSVFRQIKECTPLPFTKSEAESVERIFPDAMGYYETNARKVTVGKVGSSDIIHIATHGFYQQDDGKLPGVYSPLDNCGLFFAGVNDWHDNTKPTPHEDFGNGVLTGNEVLDLNLHKTDLLVLSACDTGLGEVKSGSGIQGLRRAFELAGVRTILCTLWSVNDLASAIFMEHFYMNLLNKKTNKLEALVEAKKYVRTMSFTRLLSYCKSKGHSELYGYPLEAYSNRSPHEQPFALPFYWAGYILQGDIT